MRKDVAAYIKYTKEGEIVNKSEISRIFNCDWRTADKYINGAESKRKPREYKTKLDDFKGTIIDKIDNYSASSMAVYNFLLKKGYTGGP